MERKYSNGGRASLIQHSESGKHRKIADGKKGRVTGQPRLEEGFLMTFFFSGVSLISSGHGCKSGEQQRGTECWWAASWRKSRVSS